MPTGDEYFWELLQAYAQNNISAQQTEELFQFLNRQPEEADRMLRELAKVYKDRLFHSQDLKAEISQRMKQSLLARINAAPETVRIQNYSSMRVRWAIAASVLLLFSTITYYLFEKQPKKELVQHIVQPQHIEKDALPGFDGAILTTASGNQIILDSTANGIVSKEEHTHVVKKDNKLIYSESSEAPTEIESFNTLSTLKGRKFQLVLADGTKVWLDAASSITYPIAFTGKQRKVQVTGQLYFEVAKDTARPFIVESAGTSVQVLGTHFNVNAYGDESAMKTTLLEGAIKITRKDRSLLLQPGQQAVISGTEAGAIQLNNAVDLDAVMAWKNGLFQFTNADLPTVLRQLARWYDMEIIYDGKIPDRKFEGKIGRDLNLSQVLKLLEKVQVKFRIDGNKLIVQP